MTIMKENDDIFISSMISYLIEIITNENERYDFCKFLEKSEI